jgi:RNA-directed DNA polymerase
MSASHTPDGSLSLKVSASVHEVEESTESLMERVVDPSNVAEALRRVRANKGSPGIDGMTVLELESAWASRGPRICEVLLAGDYVPRPVKRVTIPKPDGGERELGIPTVLDRLVQQMLRLVLEPLLDPGFSDSSYGFRPGRRVHDAVSKAKDYVAQGYAWVVDIDLERFFDRVNHDALMARLARKVSDKRVLKLVRRFLNSGVLLDGVVVRTHEGTPQGGPLSPLLSNLMLDDLDKELESRGHRFVRYADDCNIYVRSQGSAERVLASVTEYLVVKLRLRVNALKSAAAPSSERRFPGFYDLPDEGWGGNPS